MDAAWQQRLLDAAAPFPAPAGVKFSYGTAGFRLKASLLESTVFRIGLLAALRSLATGEVTGLVITASHNHVCDNGVKMVDPAGDMLVQTWEPYADEIANAATADELVKVVLAIVRKEGISSDCAKVLLARDTRPSGQSLADAAKKGIEAGKGLAVDMGILTTPQLHWMVRALNRHEPATEADYFLQLFESFKQLLKDNPNKASNSNERCLVVDGANGVGASKLLQLDMSSERGKDSRAMQIGDICVEVRNYGEGVLNESVGADYVQKEKVAPISFSAVSDTGKRCASIDGDADRLVYFYFSEDKALHLIDGDKILSLFAYFLKEQLRVIAEPGNHVPGYGFVKIGVVQTAYANGASTRYLRENGLDVVLTPTGVKYLHEEAKKFDIGLYFEANGHGTVLFKEKLLQFLASNCSTASNEHQVAMKRLLAVSKMVNQAIGDAISGLLMVEVVLLYTGWSLEDWNHMYSDLPSRQLKVRVQDRLAISTTDAETKVSTPKELQEAIDMEVDKHKGRAFVRPSGTEDVVRVYAEAGSQESADALASAVAVAVHQLAGGVSE